MDEANPELERLGFGKNKFSDLWNKEKKKKQIKLESSFSLHSFIQEGSRFFKFDGSSTEYPCKKGVWIVMQRAIGVSKSQLYDFPKTTRFFAKEKTSDITVT